MARVKEIIIGDKLVFPSPKNGGNGRVDFWHEALWYYLCGTWGDDDLVVYRQKIKFTDAEDKSVTLRLFGGPLVGSPKTYNIYGEQTPTAVTLPYDKGLKKTIEVRDPAEYELDGRLARFLLRDDMTTFVVYFPSEVSGREDHRLELWKDPRDKSFLGVGVAGRITSDSNQAMEQTWPWGE